ncbi:conserved hypothetical protein, secreted [Candidatus Magnetomorum sp. HK-1]|nr:conserved hypothetical protein, secreted [Candidatus Magnetomorum sp. HK-1]
MKSIIGKHILQTKAIMLTIMISCTTNIAFSKDINTLLSFTHTENQPNNTQQINVEWTASSIEGDFYYAAFSKGMTFVFSDESYEYDPSTPENVPDHVILPVQKINYTTNRTSYTVDTDGSYYFNIVIDSEGDYGATKTIGPFIIDTTEPSPVDIDGLTITNSNSIQLTLYPADADQVCILLNTTNTASCNWVDIPENRKLVSPTLSQGNNSIYAIYKDVAENINQASHNVTCIIEQMESTQSKEKIAVVPTLNEWGRLIFIGILLSVSIIILRKNHFSKYFWLMSKSDRIS